MRLKGVLLLKQDKVAFVSLGCAKNLVNTEQMMALCREAGYSLTGDPRPSQSYRAEHLRFY